jgi:nucleotide-binding universal stress UspA family protein
MYTNILVPTDGSALSEKAVTHGIGLAKTLGAKLTAMTVTLPFHVLAFDPATVTDTPAEYDRHATLHAAKILDAISKTAAAANVGCKTVHLVDEHPYDAIIRTADAERCDLILMASHGRRGVAALVLGSETVKVLTHSRIPVLVYR